MQIEPSFLECDNLTSIFQRSWSKHCLLGGYIEEVSKTMDFLTSSDKLCVNDASSGRRGIFSVYSRFR